MNEARPAPDPIFLEPDGASQEDPLCAFDRWLCMAKEAIGFAASAMSLATATPDGMPDVRIVLLQSVREGGLVFFTNLDSAKGSQMLANPRAAACFHWPAIGKQVRVRGSVAQVDESFADLYFGGRPRGSQIGAHASPQSSPIPDRTTLLDRVGEVEARYAGRSIPRPEHWTGMVLAPLEIEFWEDGPDRLHDRMLFRRLATGWSATRLAP